MKRWLAKFSHQKIINEYGPTETTVGVTKAILCASNVANLSYVPLGYPGNNMIISVRNNEDEEVAGTGIGELYVGGECVADGYLNRPELSQEKFIDGYYKCPKEWKSCQVLYQFPPAQFSISQFLLFRYSMI